MIAVVNTGKQGFCIVRWTGRKGLSAVAQTYCGENANAGDGVEQMPDGVKVHDKCRDGVKKQEDVLRKMGLLDEPATS